MVKAWSLGEGGYEDDLRAFGLTWEELGEGVILRAQNLARAYENPLYPATGPGLVRWLNTVRFLTELLLPRGWELSEAHRLQGRLIHRETERALVVMSGDRNTGDPAAVPRSRYPKGTATLRAVGVNEAQLMLPLFADVERRAPVDLDRYETWFLVTFVAPHVIRSELSMAVGVDDTGRVSEFRHRILLPPLANDGTAPEILPQDDGDDDDGGTAIEVPVQPR